VSAVEYEIALAELGYPAAISLVCENEGPLVHRWQAIVDRCRLGGHKQLRRPR
jgi:hypothetical protein